MSSGSKIEWTDTTWNPVQGCSLVSEGCKNCYAMKFAHRFSGPGGRYEGLTRLGNHGPTWTGKVRLVPEMLDRPLRWRKPRRVFVNSMSDLFHEGLTDNNIQAVFQAMANARRHTFQVLTKRPERMGDIMAKWWRDGLTLREGYTRRPLPNVWLGVSVEDQKNADERIPLLLQTPAAVRFVSAEPLLGPVDLRAYLHDGWCRVDERIEDGDDPEAGSHPDKGDCICFGESDRYRLNWVIVGGESGHGARPMHPDWARNIRDQCQSANVAFHFKQWGEWIHDERPVPSKKTRDLQGFQMYRVGKKVAGRELDGRTWDEFPAAGGKA